jgi:enoyl-CoA hydratase/carnithine racemase
MSSPGDKTTPVDYRSPATCYFKFPVESMANPTISGYRSGMSGSIEYSANNSGVAVLRVNRPASRNAFTWAAQEQFAATVTAAGQDPDIRVLIITGTGQAFVSGGDLKELVDHPERTAGERLNRVMSAALANLITLPYPVIGAVNGDAIGGGCEILTACDLRLAAGSARFSFRQVHNGLTTGWGGTGRLVDLIGQSRAMELLLTGRSFDAAEALALGLIHRIVPANSDVLDAAYQWAEELILLPRQALAATKMLVHAAVHLSSAETQTLEARFFVDLWSSPDHIEAMRAFGEKRTPQFNSEPG